MTGPVVVRSGDEWEIVNEDGLIYKRRKKELNSASEVPDAPIQPQNDIHWRRNRKKASLQQLKARYLAEIDEWEKLFNKFDKPSEIKVFQNELTDSPASHNSIVDGTEQKFKNMVEKLSCQVVQLEMFMEELTMLCCSVENICNRPDEYGEFYHQIKSPRVLVQAVLDQQQALDQEEDTS